MTQQVKFIAEICSNHNGDFGRATQLIKAAHEAGCDAVKFQLFKIDRMFAPKILDHPDYQFLHKRRDWELPVDWIPDIAEACHTLGLAFGCTPFYLEAVAELEPYVDFFKVASYELSWHDLITEINKTEKPLILSTGLATMNEIKATTFRCYQERDLRPLTILHCISEYPTPPEKANLSFITRLKAEILSAANVGYSDHSVNPGVIFRAVHHFGVEVIEFHLDLEDGEGAEYHLGHCWKPSQIKPVIEAVYDGFRADGSPYFEVSQFADRDFRRDPDGFRPMKYKREELS